MRPRPDAEVYRVGPDRPYRRIMDAYNAWQHDRRAGRSGPDGIIEITHSGAYQEQLDFDLDPRRPPRSCAPPRAPGR